MLFLVVAVTVIAVFWLWAREETLKKHPHRAKSRSKWQWNLPKPKPPPGMSQAQFDKQQRNAMWIGITAAVLLQFSTNGYTRWPQFPQGSQSGQASAQGTGRGEVDERNLANFPPPSLYQEISGSTSLITFINGSPDSLTLRLVRDTGERLEVEMPGCRDCSTYAPDRMPTCGTVGTPTAFQVPPGNYQVRGLFWGSQRTHGFQSAWSLTPGWEYRQCIYTTDEMRY